jgi:glycosyltransferase involved in cell wall biosynthesis
VRAASPVVVLSSRRLEPVYDVATLLRAWRRLPPQSGMQLRVAGAGADEASLRSQAAPEVQFLGWLAMSDLDRELRAAHIYVSTSLSDSTSVSLLEAMAAGCFPVVSDIPANREWIVDGETGLLFPCGDDAALATALQRAASDQALRQRAAARNREVIAARATWEANLREVENLFERLAAKPLGG